MKEFLTGNFRLGSEKVVARMFNCAGLLHAFGEVMTIKQQVDAVKRVTAAEVQAVAKAIFRPANRSISWVLPEKQKAGA